MTIEYLGLRIFLEEIKATNQLWVARNCYGLILATAIDSTGFSLPVWSSSRRVGEFLQAARLVGPKYEPHAVPVETFTAAWLSDKGLAIAELQINPDGRSSRALVMDPDEFRAVQGQS